MTIIDILKQRSENTKDDVKIELKLYNLADDLEKRSRNHLKRISTVLTEFDIHDEKHSEKVIENIELLLGNEKLRSLSTYELFLLHLSAFFHDCAMAPSDWEINTMKLTEGSETYSHYDFSIKHDLKTPLLFSAAQKVVTDNKPHLYKRFDSDVKEWMFTPRNEDELIKYLSTLLIEYQNCRNGFADKLKNVKSQEEFYDLSEFIRIDYIRATHHTRIETYIKNLETKFSQAFEQPAWGKKLAQDLSLICRSHGEDAIYINKFSTNAQYYGAEYANLQFVAIMLRLGDIIHFSYDRAPIDLRSSKLFKSEYSFQQWAIKRSGVNYSIDNGKIAFRAHCENPETYFKLHQYIDWIEIEIQNYFRFQRQWAVNYIDNLKDKIERSNVTNDEDIFLPKRGLNFTLNQNKILDLLMGVGLYKDKFACVRELYQNSLDAVRCMLSQCEVSNSSAKGLIEFRLIKEEEKVYLCCIDNGIGMTKDVIENYLLKIGNSYYKSADFFKQQAKWGGRFTPTSQFGIGILSCFMIGSKLEITTKTMKEGYVSCVIEGLHESFYYKNTSPSDKEFIPGTGTMIKVLLNEGSQLNDKKINKIGLLLLGITNDLPKEFKTYLLYKEMWKEHLFNIINYFVQIIPDNIALSINIENDTPLQIQSKPIFIDVEDPSLDIGKEDIKFVDYLNNYKYDLPGSHKLIDAKCFSETYELCIQYKDTSYITSLTFPLKGNTIQDPYKLNQIPKHGEHGICIDGILVEEHGTLLGKYDSYLQGLAVVGMLNFTGESRPQISVDRTSIIEYSKECEQIVYEITKLLISRMIEIAKQHIVQYNLEIESRETSLLWKYVFSKMYFADNLYLNEFSVTAYGDIHWKELNNKLFENKSVRDFFESKAISIRKLDMPVTDRFTEKILLKKIIGAKEIKIEDLTIFLKEDNEIKNNEILWEEDLLICADHWGTPDEDFDIISNLFPLIPKRLFDLIDESYVRKVNSRIKVREKYLSEIINLVSLSPIMLHNTLDAYFQEQGLFGKQKNNIFKILKQSKSKLSDLKTDFLVTNQNEKYVVLIYITPYQLTPEEAGELGKYINIDPSYLKGIHEGWSILATSMKKNSAIIAPGKATREYLVSLISDEFWEEYKDYTFKFTDNTIMTKCTSSTN